MKIHGYVRVSTNEQDTENQKGEIRRYLELNKLQHIDEWHDINISSRKSLADRKIDYLIDSMEKGDILVCSELSRLGRSLSQLTNIVDKIILKGCRVVFIKNNMDIDPLNKNDVQNKIMLTMFGLFAELERDFISQRIKEALKTKKDNGQKLGRLKGAVVGSKYDKFAPELITLLNEHGEKWTKIITIMKERHKDEFNATRQSLSNWCNKKLEKRLGGLYGFKEIK